MSVDSSFVFLHLFDFIWHAKSSLNYFGFRTLRQNLEIKYFGSVNFLRYIHWWICVAYITDGMVLKMIDTGTDLFLAF